LGPITLPCAGPVVVTAFLLGAGSASTIGSELLYFLVFGLGFGWPLVLLPFVAVPLQRRFTKWMTANYTLLTRFSGVLLILIGLLGIYADLLPQL
jgi:cytochrome c-type biogenesis protein